MKAQSKALIASVVVIALALSAVSGVTYSWFSDSESANIEVTAGSINLIPDGSFSGSVTSEGRGTVEMGETEKSTPLNGKVSMTAGSSGSSSYLVKIIFNGIADNDVISINAPAFKLTNTILANYYESLIVEDSNHNDITSSCNYFVVDGLQTAAKECPVGDEQVVSQAKTITIKFDSNNSAGGQKFYLTLKFTAIQANAPVPSGQETTIGGGIDVSSTITNSSSTGSTSIFIESTNTTSVVGTKFVMEEATSETAESYAAVLETNIISGVELKGYDADGHQITNYLIDVPVNLTFVVEGDVTDGDGWLSSSIKIFHGDRVFDTNTNNTSVSYDSILNKTKIIVTTTEGFSPYFVTTGVVKLANKYYNTLDEAINYAKDGDIISLLKDINQNEVRIENKEITIDLNGNTIKHSSGILFRVIGSTLTLSGGAIETTNIPIFIYNGSTTTINNVDINTALPIYVSTDKGPYNYKDSLTLTEVNIISKDACVCAFKGATVNSDECTFTSTNTGAGFITNGTKGLNGQTWTISDCVFNISSSSKNTAVSVGIMCHNGDTWTISDCVFNVIDGVGVSVRGGNVTINNCVYNGSKTDGFDSRVKLVYTDPNIPIEAGHAIAVKYSAESYGFIPSTEAGASTLTIDGTSYTTSNYVDFTGYVDTKYQLTNDGTSEEPIFNIDNRVELYIFSNMVSSNESPINEKNVTFNINSDIDMYNCDWKPITVKGYEGAKVVTVNGNNHTISGLKDSLFAGGFAGTSGIIIKDLILKDVSIVNDDNDQGVGAFICSVDSMPTITLENCHLVDSSIISTGGARVGGLIGWTSGYNVETDGPVDLSVTITNCSVKNCTITAAGSVGAIIGHAGANPATFHTISGNNISGCTLKSTDDGGWRVGIVVGTANTGKVIITDTTESGNDLSQVGKTSPDHSNIYGRFVPDGTGKLTIDGTSITS